MIMLLDGKNTSTLCNNSVKIFKIELFSDIM